MSASRVIGECLGELHHAPQFFFSKLLKHTAVPTLLLGILVTLIGSTAWARCAPIVRAPLAAGIVATLAR